MADQVGRHALNLAAVEFDGAAVRREQAGYQVEQRGLAGAVRTDQRVDLAGADRKAGVVDGADAAEMLGDAGHLQHGALETFGQQETR